MLPTGTDRRREIQVVDALGRGGGEASAQPWKMCKVARGVVKPCLPSLPRDS